MAFSFVYEEIFIAAARQTLVVWSTNWMDDYMTLGYEDDVPVHTHHFMPLMP